MVFCLKTAVIQRALPPAGWPGKRPGGVRVRERERESLGGSTPQSLLVSWGWGAVAGATSIAPAPGPAGWGRGVCPGAALPNLPETCHSGNSAGQRGAGPRPPCPQLISKAPALRKSLWFCLLRRAKTWRGRTLPCAGRSSS